MQVCSGLQASAVTQRSSPAAPMRQALPARTVRASSSRDARAVSTPTRMIRAQRLASIVARAAATEQEIESEVADQTQADPRACYLDVIMFQAFGWESCNKGNWYGIVQSKIEDYKRAGFTHIWLPPPSNSVAPQGYMPGQLYNLSSSYGNQEQLIELNKKLTEAGIKPMGDIVINHRCACEQGPDGVWNRFGDDVDHEGHKIDWDQWAITSNDPHFRGTGNPDTGEDFGGAPDLDHANPALRDGLKHWLEHLNKNIGFAGWRFDYSKGYGASFVQEYIDASVGPGTVNVGEYWTDLKWNGGDLDYNQDGPRQTLCDWINGAGRRCAAFDFPTKGILQEAVKNCQYNRLRDGAGKAPGLIGWWPKMAVTFVDNHDTGSTQAHWPFPSDRVGAGYAYILTHPGSPCIFWEHYFDWGNDMQKTIDTLIQVRKRNGIKSNAKLEILAADHDMYVAKIDDKVMLKMGPRYDMGNLKPNKDEWVKAINGKDFCVWERKSA